MKYVVKYRGVAGNTEVFWYLKATTWTSELSRADKFDSMEQASVALDKAAKFAKKSVIKAARIVEYKEPMVDVEDPNFGPDRWR